MDQNLHVIVGLGMTGMSCARYLKQKNIPFALTDSRSNPPNLQEFIQDFPDVVVSVGKLDEDLLGKASKIIMSPGVSVKEPAIQKYIDTIPVIGDIELFAQTAESPIIAITGTNAKSTVTTLVAEMAIDAQVFVGVGGNLGYPALDLLTTPYPKLFVLELSSFQLETTFSLKPKVATILNVTPDHMDRYATIDDYHNAKQRIYANCEIAVANRDDARTHSNSKDSKNVFFTLTTPKENEFGLLTDKGEIFLALGTTKLISTRELPVLGKHYQANALAALAIGYSYGFAIEAMLKTLQRFKGLPHRCQLVRTRNEVSWYNDSKGTNVGATLAAIEGLGAVIPGKLILIAGGQGKKADFSSLIPAMQNYVKLVILIGEDAKLIAATINEKVPVKFAKTMQDAAYLADGSSLPNDCVLLSPACASFDMFKNFEHRGDVFSDIVRSL
jgi:UDP-N-acetylmuramoylalanine--D-glutamate ligase